MNGTYEPTMPTTMSTSGAAMVRRWAKTFTTISIATRVTSVSATSTPSLNHWGRNLPLADEQHHAHDEDPDSRAHERDPPDGCHADDAEHDRDPAQPDRQRLVQDDRDPAAQGEQDDAHGQREEVVVPEGLQRLDLGRFHLAGRLADRDEQGAVDGGAYGEDHGTDERDPGEHPVLAGPAVEHRSQV